MKTTIRIATGQYEYLEVEGTDNDIPELLKLQNMYSEKPINFGRGSKRIRAFAGGEIDYDPIAHIYSWNGEKYLSGSVFAKQFEKAFEGQSIAEKMATKFGVDAQAIQDMWELKGQVSAGFGTAIHAALELYGKYNGLATTLEKETHLHDHPIIKKAVEDFYKGREKEKAEYEILVVDHETKRAGQIDRLLITGKNKCRIQDFKTNAKLPEAKLNVYWEQLKFYAGIMIAAGWAVEGLDIFWWDGEWKEYNKEATK